MSKSRKRLVALLEDQRKVGMLNEQMILEKLAEYDALEATHRMPLYALLSTIVAALSAMASAAAAYFAYAALNSSGHLAWWG
jgi:hypothetical protein